MGDWFYVTYAARHYPFGQFWIPGGRDRYFKTTSRGEDFPHYLKTNATLTGLAMTRTFKTWIRAGWLTDPNARRSRCHPFSGENRGQVLS